jgi:hypothetical protein
VRADTAVPLYTDKAVDQRQPIDPDNVIFPDPAADLLKLVLVVEALDQDEPLDRELSRGGSVRGV